MADRPPHRPALRLVPGGHAFAPRRAVVPDAIVERAVVAVVATSGGLPRRLLTAMVQSWLAVRRPGEQGPDGARVLRSLAMCMLRGEVDAEGGLLVPGPAGRQTAV